LVVVTGLIFFFLIAFRSSLFVPRSLYALRFYGNQSTIDEEERVIAEQCPISQGEEDLGLILDALPEHLRDALLADGRLHGLVEIVLDLGRPLMARFSGPGLPRVAEIAGRGGEGENVVSEHDLDHFSNSITRFDSENRHAPHTPHTHHRT
jgi:hypothetical protein